MKTKAPKEDPAVVAAREREERRADAAYIEGTANLLDEETRRRIRRFGRRGAASRAVAGGGFGGGAGGVGGTAGGSYDPGVGGGPSGGPGGRGGNTFADLQAL